jgi:hypothetical protein
VTGNLLPTYTQAGEIDKAAGLIEESLAEARKSLPRGSPQLAERGRLSTTPEDELMQPRAPRKNVGLVLGLLSIVGLGVLVIRVGWQGRPATAAEIREQARQLSEAVARGDFETAADMTYPKVITLAGGRAKLIALMRAALESAAEEDMKILPGTIGEPSEAMTQGANMFVVVPITSEFATSKGKLVGKSYLLGVSSDKGRTWSFVQGGSFDDPKFRAQLLPTLPPGLTLPADEEPHLVPNEQAKE